MRQLKRNRVKCKLCGDVIESKRTHELVACKCGEIFVDGGLDYSRCGAKHDLGNIIPMCEYVEEKGGEE